MNPLPPVGWLGMPLIWQPLPKSDRANPVGSVPVRVQWTLTLEFVKAIALYCCPTIPEGKGLVVVNAICAAAVPANPASISDAKRTRFIAVLPCRPKRRNPAPSGARTAHLQFRRRTSGRLDPP